jgi:hypothetical protein
MADCANSILVNDAGCATVTGVTASSDFPTRNAWDSNYNGGWDTFITQIAPAGNSLVFSTFIGGSNDDVAYSIAADATGCLYFSGWTESIDYPIQNPWDASLGGLRDAFSTKFDVGTGASFCDYFSGIFCDDFEDEPDPGWTQSGDPCSWNVVDGAWNAGLSDAWLQSLQTTGDDTWDNYVLELKLRGNSGVDKAVRFRDNSDGSFYHVDLRSDWYGQDELLLYRTVGGEATNLQSVSYPSENEIWYQIRVVCIGNHIAVSVDGDEVMALTDTSNPIASGGIGLWCWTGEAGNCDVSFDDVTVTNDRGAIAGIITSNVGGSVGGALIRILEGETEVGSAESNDDGDYLVLDLPAATYSVEVSIEGYETSLVTDVMVSPGGITNLDVELTPEPVPYFIHLTDTHYGYCGSSHKNTTVLVEICSWEHKPEFVLVTGDIVSFGAIADEPTEFSIDDFGPCVDLDENRYELGEADGQRLRNNGSEYYVCPGNHDYYSLPGWTVDLQNYLQHFTNENYEDSEGDVKIFGLNSGSDFAVDDPPPGNGLFDPQMSWLTARLDLLDGTINGMDLSSLRKVVMLHHPIINYKHPLWNRGTIVRNRDDFKTTCNDYDVDLVCVGHTHEDPVYEQTMDGDADHKDGYPDGAYPLSTANRTLYVQTGAAYDGCYRKIDIYPDRLEVHQQRAVEDNVNVTLVGGGSAAAYRDDLIGCPAHVHLYDALGNHVGVNDTLGLDLEIDGVAYSLYPLVAASEPDSVSWDTTAEELSAFIGPAGFTFEIHGKDDGSISIFVEKITTEGHQVELDYDSVEVYSTSVGKLYVMADSIDYTIYFDDDGDSVIDRTVDPTEIYPPEYTCGDTEGSGSVNVSDIVYLISYVFADGPPPDPVQGGDVDCNAVINVSDIVFLISFVFGDGYAPCDSDGNLEPDC